MNWWTRVFRAPTAADQHDHTDTQENPLPRTPTQPATVDEQIATIRDQIAALDVEAAADPLDIAEDINEWSRRDQQRRDRRIALEREIRQRREFGELYDDHPAMDAVRSFTSATAEARTKLHPVAEARAWPLVDAMGDQVPRTDGKAPRRLESWWHELVRLANALPDGPDADRLITEEVRSWYRAKEGLAAAICSAHGVELVAPEREPLPRGLVFGAHRPAGAQPA